MNVKNVRKSLAKTINNVLEPFLANIILYFDRNIKREMFISSLYLLRIQWREHAEKQAEFYILF